MYSKIEKARMSKNEKLLKAALKKAGVKALSILAIYETDADDSPEVDLTKTVMVGEALVHSTGSEFFGNGRGFVSEVVTNPTYLDMMVICGQMIEATGDEHHVFLETISPYGFNDNGTTILNFFLGS